MEDLFKSLPELLNQFDGDERLWEAIVFATWRRTVGKSLCEHTSPLQLIEKKLVVAVSDKMWKRHLESLAGQMVFKLNSNLRQAAVTFIEFRIDETAAVKDRKSKCASILSDSELEEIALEEITADLRRSADSIEDDELRYQFLLAAGSCLAHKKRVKYK